jgi:hypothetical protein
MLNTYYEHLLPRSWYQYWNGEPKQTLKFFYTKKPIRSQCINWKIIKEQNIFQEIRRHNIQLRALKKRIRLLEINDDKEEIEENDEYDVNSYHQIM